MASRHNVPTQAVQAMSRLYSPPLPERRTLGGMSLGAGKKEHMFHLYRIETQAKGGFLHVAREIFLSDA